jgi:hypothetical protein
MAAARLRWRATMNLEDRMNRSAARIAVVSCMLTLAGGPALAQSLELPRPSPNAKIVQNVGLTEIAVDYSAPRVNGRKIWGGLLPWGEVWRAGANAATKLTVSRDVTVGGTKVPAGSYSMFVIPQKTGAWSWVINRNPTASTGQYKKEDDVVRVEVKPQTLAQARERLAYGFSDFAVQNKASLDLEWDKVRLSLPIKVGTDEQVAANLKAYEENQWSPLNTAARYMLEQKKDLDSAVTLVDKSLALKEGWFNTWTKAQIMAAKGKQKDALALAQKADALGEKETPADRYFFKDEVKAAITEWKKAAK